MTVTAKCEAAKRRVLVVLASFLPIVLIKQKDNVERSSSSETGQGRGIDDGCNACTRRLEDAEGEACRPWVVAIAQVAGSDGLLKKHLHDSWANAVATSVKFSEDLDP